MKVPGPFPFLGEVIWLTAEQGGRRNGPPPDPDNYAVTAFVPPHTVETGLASFVLRRFDPASYRSTAEGRWLLVENAGPQRVTPGCVVAVTEGARVVAYYVVAEVFHEQTRPPSRVR